MNEEEWREFLAEYNRELLTYEEVVESIPGDVVKAGWLGYPGASDSAVAATEKRLGQLLPPSYRAFLKVSDGWRFPSVFILNLLAVSKVAWFRDQNQDWIDIHTGFSADVLLVSDSEYFKYGAKQDCANFRAEYLTTALQIAEVGDSGVVLLNPKITTSAGEWETWFFANWLPGAVRYRSFAEWLASERSACRKRLTPIPKAKVMKYVTAKKPVSARKAQEAGRRGETELALESLEGFAAKGDNCAAASLAELYAFLGKWDKVVSNAGRLIANPKAVYAGNVFDDMVRLLGRAGRRLGEWSKIIEVVEAASKASANRYAEWFRRFTGNKGTGGHNNPEQRYEPIFRNLIEYAGRKGRAPHELVEIGGSMDCMAQMSDSERKAWYDNAVKNVELLRPDLKKNPRAKMEHFFSLAKGVMENEALRLYEEHGKTFVMAWQAVEYVAPIYVQRGKPEMAWVTIESNLKHWWPVDHAQVAPLFLLTNDNLAALMTPERCQLVLSTPRGPEGAKQGK